MAGEELPGRYGLDPVGFAREVLGVSPWAKQEAILLAVRDHPRVSVRSCHGVGKTFVAAVAALWWLYCHRPSLVLSTAPTARQVEGLLWAEIRRLKRQAKVPLGGRALANSLVVDEHRQGLGLSTNEPERFAGWHAEHLLAIVDEASGVSPAIFEPLLGVLTGAHSHLLLIGNPTRSDGLFYQSHQAPGWEAMHLSAFDSPNFTAAEHGYPYPSLITPEWVAARAGDWGEESAAYQVRVLGQFPAGGTDALVARAWLEAAAGQCRVSGSVGSVGSDGLERGTVLGVDVARFGECETVIALRKGDLLARVEAWQGADLMGSCGRVIARSREARPTAIVVDAVGLGAGLVDRLRERQREGEPALKGVALVAFGGGERALAPLRYRSRRDEAYWLLRERYREGTIRHAGPFPRLVEQLAALRYDYDSTGKIAVESKATLRRRGLPSPDQADAVALAFAPLSPLARGFRPRALGASRGVVKTLPGWD